MKKMFVFLAIAPVLFLVLQGQACFAQLKQESGLYYPYNLVSDDKDVQIYGMPIQIPPESNIIRFFADTLPYVKYLDKNHYVDVYDSTYRFNGGLVLKKSDSFFLKMCDPYMRVNPGDSITIVYLVTKNQQRFNFDVLVKYYNGKPVAGKVYYQIKPRKLFGQYDIVGDNTTLETDPLDKTVKTLLTYEANKRKIAKLVPVKPVTTGAVTYIEEKKKGGKVVVKILQDGEPAFPPLSDSVKYKDSVSRRIAFVSDSMQKVKTADSIQKAQLASKADSTTKAKIAIAKAAKDAERRADSIRRANDSTAALAHDVDQAVAQIKRDTVKYLALVAIKKLDITSKIKDFVFKYVAVPNLPSVKLDEIPLANTDTPVSKVHEEKHQSSDFVSKKKNVIAKSQKEVIDSINNVTAIALLEKRIDSLKQVKYLDSLQADSIINEKKAIAKEKALLRKHEYDVLVTTLDEALEKSKAESRRRIAVAKNELQEQELMDSVRHTYRLDSIAHSYEQLGVVNRMKQNNEFKKLVDSFQEQTIVQKTFVMPNPPKAMFENMQSPNIVSTIPAKDERYITIQGVTYDREKYDIKLIEGPSTDGPNGRKIRHFHYQIKKK